MNATSASNLHLAQRQLEAGIQTDYAGRLDYGAYLRLGPLLACQAPLSNPPQHDETLFIVQHQVAELWFKLLIHELRAVLALVRSDAFAECQQHLERSRLIQQQLSGMWCVLETMTPTSFATFRPQLGQASGFQSHQYRTLEFILGNKNAGHAVAFRHDPQLYQALLADLQAPSLWDEVLCAVARHGFALPLACTARDFGQPYVAHAAVAQALMQVYQQRAAHPGLHQLLEQLVALEDEFQLWRFRHLKTVARFIGARPGTGGSSSSAFLKKALELSFFPELLQIRPDVG